MDREKVLEAVLKCPPGPAREEAARLLEAYLERLESFPDTGSPTLGVEVPWYIPLGKKIFAVGVVDRILDDEDRTICEWKTKGAPKLKKDGEPYKGSTEKDWLEEIGGGVQLGVYGLARREGIFLFPEPVVLGSRGRIRVLVRAAIKSNPPDIWPRDPSRGLFTFEVKKLDAVKAALLAEAYGIRAVRKARVKPWGLVGDQCHKYGRDCQHLSQCREFVYPEVESQGFHPTDPGFVVCQMLGLDPKDPELVVISQSGYQVAQRCREKYRREYSGGGGEGEQSFELQVGTVYHAGMAAIYR